MDNKKNMPIEFKGNTKKHTLFYPEDGKAMIMGECCRTGEEYTTSSFNLIGYMSWYLDNNLIQECLPELSDEDREFLISGLSPKGWYELFGEIE